MKKELIKLKQKRKTLIKEFKTEKSLYLNYKIKAAERKVRNTKITLYITGVLILISLPLTLIETISDKSITKYYNFIFLFENIILTIAPIFFGFCLFKIFEWTKEYEELVEKNIEYNIDFIKIINWEFRKLIKTIEELNANNPEAIKNNRSESEDNPIYKELDGLIEYINEYSHFNSEKFEKEIIFSIQREWYNILDLVNYIKKSNIIKVKDRINSLNKKIKHIKTKPVDYTDNHISNTTDNDDGLLEYQSIYKFSICINRMNEWSECLKNILNLSYKLNTEINKNSKRYYKKLLKYYIYLINFNDIKYISKIMIFDIYNHKKKMADMNINNKTKKETIKK